jgi:RHS repeat-associated protein
MMARLGASYNQPPVAVDDSYQVHGTTALGSMLANDHDPDGDSIHFDSYVSLPQHGILTGVGYPTAPNYIPNFGYVGSDSYVYRTCDSGGLCATATIKVNVVNNAPIAEDDNFTAHGATPLDSVMTNDHDSDHDAIHFDSYVSLPQHGSLTGAGYPTAPNYIPNFGYLGSDSYTYRICDSLGQCGTGTVTVNVVNQAPVAVSENFTVHGTTALDSVMTNDYDPDHDAIHFDSYVSLPQHGVLTGAGYPTAPNYIPTSGYVGTDFYTYRICDSLGLCAVSTVTVSVVNHAPVPVAEDFKLFGTTFLENLLANDSDPDVDPIHFDSYVSLPQHGNLVGVGFPTAPTYVPNSGYVGSDSLTYRICDNLGLCADVTDTLWIFGPGENDGATSCQMNVGRPINVSNGNMYLQQSDYQLPSIGPGLNVTRTYNSNSQRIGLFGRGWSTMLDESILSYDASMLRFNHGGGRAVHFGRASGSTGAFSDLVGDLHEQVISGGGGFTLSMKDGSAEQFDSAGKLLSMTDRNGNTTTLTYGATGFLSSVTDPFGRVLTVNTNTNGQVTSISDSLGTIATYTYGVGSELLSVTYADNSAFNFSYDGGLRLTSVTDAMGNVVESHTYDGQGRAITSEKHGGVEHYSLSFVSATETDVTDGLGRVTKYFFDSSKGRNVATRVEGLCSCGGGAASQVQTWTYDNQLNVTSKTDALNHVISYTYDGSGNRLTQTDPTGTITYTYNGFAEVLTHQDQMDGVTTNTYDGLGNLRTTTDALNNTTTVTYSGRGQVLTATDARNKITTFTYDSTGNLTQRKDPNNIITFFFYDARGRLTKVRDGLSRSSLYVYDAFGRINKVTHPDNSFVTFTYDLAGRRTVVTDERGNPTNFAYDGAGRLSSITDTLNHATTYAYDGMSNLRSMTDALSRTTNYDYDEFNRLKKTMYPPATPGATRLFELVTYDADGNVTSQRDTDGRVTTHAHDNLNRVIGTTDSTNKTTTFQYDALSRVTLLTDPINQQYQFVYDALSRQTQITRGSSSMSYVYDEVGNRIQRTDYNGAVTNYSYDNLNRLTTVTYPARTVTYAYDSLNNLTRATNENGSVYIGYDSRYRVASFTDPFFYGISYNYDTVGNRTKLKVNGAIYATYTYDQVNRMTSLADSANLNFTYNYDAVNRVTSRGAPNGVTTGYAYDDLDRLTSLIHTGGPTTLNGNLYTFNDANNLSSWTTQTAQRAYAYDAMDRLTGVTNFETPAESYSYDAAGNRTSSHLSASYSYNSVNKLVSTASATYTYDNNGNVITRTDGLGTTTFTFNEENQLTRARLPNGLTVDYKYDGLGRRIQRTTSAGANERYVYDGPDVLIDLNADWSVATTYLNDLGNDNHLRQTNTTTGTSYFLTDHLGSTAAFADGRGNLIEQITYDSFGNSPGSARSRYGFTGRERDPDTSLMYYRARFYDPQIGRFMSEDPLGFAGGLNGYTYTRNNPLTRKDPSGLYDIDVHYYLTYYLAMVTGCFSPDDAKQIAEGDLRSDLDEDKKPGWGKKWQLSWHGPVAVPYPEQQARNRDFHSFGTHEQNTRRSAELWAQATRGTGSLLAFGTYLHFMQDSYSHWDFAGNLIWGQTSGGNSVDHTNFAPGKAMDMAHHTYDDLQKFAEMRGCPCHGNPDWDLVKRFIGVGYDLSTRAGRAADYAKGVSDDQLREKIDILRVPDRTPSWR